MIQLEFYSDAFEWLESGGSTAKEKWRGLLQGWLAHTLLKMTNIALHLILGFSLSICQRDDLFGQCDLSWSFITCVMSDMWLKRKGLNPDPVGTLRLMAPQAGRLLI